MSPPVAPAAPDPLPAVANDWPAHVSMPPQNLPETDGEKLESNWHRDAMNLLVELIRFVFLGRTDFFVGGNMFIHFSARQVRNLDFRGPDVFLVKDVDGTYDRPYWAVWNEEGRYPNLIIELLSPTTVVVDRTTKKDVYERTFRTPELFHYDPETLALVGWRLDVHQRYQPIPMNQQGRLWSEQLGVWLGTWVGQFQNGFEATWLRFFTASGDLVPLFAENAREVADKAKEVAEKAQDRAEKAEADLAKLKTLLAEKGLLPPDKA